MCFQNVREKRFPQILSPSWGKRSFPANFGDTWLWFNAWITRNTWDDEQGRDGRDISYVSLWCHVFFQLNLCKSTIPNLQRYFETTDEFEFCKFLPVVGVFLMFWGERKVFFMVVSLPNFQVKFCQTSYNEKFSKILEESPGWSWMGWLQRLTLPETNSQSHWT